VRLDLSSLEFLAMLTTAPTPNALLVDVREAARMLSISTRTLWSLTDSGEIPAVRIGRSVRYSVATLRDWINHREAGAPKEGDQ
jgi:excisionase family DNA binding protein